MRHAFWCNFLTYSAKRRREVFKFEVLTTTRPTTETLSFSASKSLLIAYSLRDLPLYFSKTSKVSIITIKDYIFQTTQPNISAFWNPDCIFTCDLQSRRILGFEHFGRHVVLIRWKRREGKGNGKSKYLTRREYLLQITLLGLTCWPWRKVASFLTSTLASAILSRSRLWSFWDESPSVNPHARNQQW